MSTRRKAARFNRLVGNRVAGKILPLMPGFGAVCHRGRRSGRSYRTPVKLFRHGDRYLISLPYGPDSDWVRNVVAAGGCELRTRGRTIRLADPRVFRDPGLAAAPRPVRLPLRWFRAYDFIELRPVDTPAPAPP
jgi:deazaflavin-dependent oxidoreductase (nitroreductase family)